MLRLLGSAHSQRPGGVGLSTPSRYRSQVPLALEQSFNPKCSALPPSAFSSKAGFRNTYFGRKERSLQVSLARGGGIFLLLEWRWNLSRALTFKPLCILAQGAPRILLGADTWPLGIASWGAVASIGHCARNWAGTDCVKETSYSSHFIKVIFVHWKIIIM